MTTEQSKPQQSRLKRDGSDVDPISPDGIVWQEKTKQPCGCWGAPVGQHIPGCSLNTSKYPDPKTTVD